jgi:hypothetical protein
MPARIIAEEIGEVLALLPAERRIQRRGPDERRLFRRAAHFDEARRHSCDVLVPFREFGVMAASRRPHPFLAHETNDTAGSEVWDKFPHNQVKVLELRKFLSINLLG